MIEFKLLPVFLSDIKKLQKKFPSIKKDVLLALRKFDKKTAQFLGKHNYKIRIKSSDFKKGKNKGFRLILHIILEQNKGFPLTIYFKSSKSNINQKELLEKMKNFEQDIQ